MSTRDVPCAPLMVTMENTKDKILIGEITSAVGIKGEVKVKSYAEYPERFGEFGEVLLGEDNTPTKVELRRVKGLTPILKITGVDDRNSAEDLRGTQLYIFGESLEDLPEDTYYVKDLIGLKVLDENNNEIGEVTDVNQNGPHDIYVIKEKTEGAEVLVPAVKEFILEVNIDKGYVKIHFIEGMLP